MKNRGISRVIMMTMVALSGCVHCQPDEGETMRPLASALTKLSPQVEAVVRYGTPPPNATDAELLALATKNDPGTLGNFTGYTLRVYTQDRHAIVLLCDAAGKRGLLEDLGCTGMLDRNLWNEDVALPCEFSLSVERGCKKK